MYKHIIPSEILTELLMGTTMCVCVKIENAVLQSALWHSVTAFISNPHSLLILQVISKCCPKQVPLPSETQALHSPAGFVSDLSLNNMPEHRYTHRFCYTAHGFLFSEELCARFSAVAQLLIFSDLLPPQPCTPAIKIDFSPSHHITISHNVLALLLDNVSCTQSRTCEIRLLYSPESN